VQLRVVTIVCAAVTAVELGVVVVRWTACSTPAPPPPPADAAMAHFAPADAAASSHPPTKRITFAELNEVAFEHQFATGEATVPYEWPDGFQPVYVRYALEGAVRIATGRGPIELHDAAFTRMFTAELTIRAGNRLVIDYDAPHEREPWKGQLDCTLPADRPIWIARMETDPPLADLDITERERSTGELRSHWRGTPPGGRDYGYPPVCVLDVPDESALEVSLRVPMPPVKGQIVQLVHRDTTMRVQVNDSTSLTCDRQLVRVVAFDHVPASSRLGTDDEGKWLVTRIADSAFGFTCTGGGTIIPVKVGYGMTDLKCTLADNTLKCPGR
jgi:hypothetical protein